MSGGVRSLCLVAGVIGASLALIIGLKFAAVAGQPTYGATFSPDYARSFGVDAGQAYMAVLDDLGVRQVRIPLQWYSLQPTPEGINFSDIDWYVDQAARRNVKVILVVGNKVPRWPECYTPGWASALPRDEYEAALLDYVDQVVAHYRNVPVLQRWQVENEPLFAFGRCPKIDYSLVQREIAHVRALDDVHPIELTVSGEQQLWASVATEADVIGASLYRRAALPNGWRFTFPISPRWYSLQALSVSPFTRQVVISELQAEPWLVPDYRAYSLDEAVALFTPDDLAKVFRFAHRTGIKEISVWGVEWWYYLKQNGHPELWEAGKQLLKTKN